MGRKRVAAILKVQIPAGEASPAPPVGPALGQYGINIMEFVKSYNDATRAQVGTIVPAEITIYTDRSFSFVTKSPPTAVLLRQAARVEKGSPEPHRGEGRHPVQGSDQADRRDQAPRPEHEQRRSGHEDRGRHCPVDGDHRLRLTRPFVRRSGGRDNLKGAFTLCASFVVAGPVVGLWGGGGVWRWQRRLWQGLLTKAYPQGTLRRQDAARGVDGGSEHADRHTERPRINTDGRVTARGGSL